jgi:hypothetical protein
MAHPPHTPIVKGSFARPKIVEGLARQRCTFTFFQIEPCSMTIPIWPAPSIPPRGFALPLVPWQSIPQDMVDSGLPHRGFGHLPPLARRDARQDLPHQILITILIIDPIETSPGSAFDSGCSHMLSDSRSLPQDGQVAVRCARLSP